MLKVPVMLVEDEAASMRHIHNLILNYCPQFSIVAQCENGREAMQLLADKRPELVITDIKMPVMDGIELMENIRKEHPDIDIIILSGYADFEYAQSAVRQGAVNYILKPVSPKTFTKVMADAAASIQQRISHALAEFIWAAADHRSFDAQALPRYFPHPSYYIGVLRKNGLLQRGRSRRGDCKPSLQCGLINACGRDENELFLFLPAGREYTPQDFISAVQNLDPFSGEGYLTKVILNRPLPVKDLPDAISRVCKILDEAILLDTPSCHIISKLAAEPSGGPLLSASTVKSIEYSVTEANDANAKLIIKGLIEEWANRQIPLIQIRNEIRIIFENIKNHGGCKVDYNEFEWMMEDAFGDDASSVEKLLEDLFGILAFICGQKDEQVTKLDTPEYFSRIEEYITHHLSDSLSLQGLCCRFHVSQAYLSKLFRKYTGHTFQQYLLKARIDFAKSLMDSSAGIKIRDVAALAGFSDQFYFSKQFKRIVGVTPTEYMQ